MLVKERQYRVSKSANGGIFALCLYLINCYFHRIRQMIVIKRNLQNYLWFQSNTKLHSQKLVRIGGTYYGNYLKEGNLN